MNLNATLLAQVVVFLVLAAFTMKFVWPPLMSALDERAKKIADGLSAADRGKADLAVAEKRIQSELMNAQTESQRRIAEAEKRAQAIIDEAKKTAAVDAARIVDNAKSEANQHVAHVREQLRNEVAVLAVKGAEKILQREVDSAAHADILNQLKAAL